MKIFTSLFVLVTAGIAAIWFFSNSGGPNNAESILRGQALYGDNCASCHGVNLEGQPEWQTADEFGIFPAPPHDASGHTWHHDDSLLFDYTQLGGAKAMAARGLEDFQSGMPAFEGLLSDSEIDDVWNYIKSTWSDVERDVQAERTAAEIDANS